MARKVLNRKELREENEAAERAEAENKTEKKSAAEKKSAVEKKSVKKTVKKKAVRKSRAKVVKEVRLKAFWGVFNQSLRRVAVFEYNQRKEAQKKAEDLSQSARTPHFVQLVKEVIEE